MTTNRLKKRPFSIVLLVAFSVFLYGCVDSKSGQRETNITLDMAMGKERIIPVAVIGSGPAGLSAAMYGAAAMMQTIVFDGDEPGGLLTKTTLVENWPGILPKMGPEIMDESREQARRVGAKFIADTIVDIDVSEWPYVLKTENDDIYRAMTIVVATGSSPRMIGIPGENEYMGYGVSTCALCDRGFFKEKDVIVVGGGDSAAEEAMQLSPYAKTVHVLVRKDRMRASARMQDRMRGHKNVTVLYNTELKEVLGRDLNGIKEVTGIKLLNNKTNETYDKPMDGVFLAIGHDPNSWFLEGRVDMDAGGHIIVQGRTQKTSLPGIYAAGEVEDHDYRQAGVAAGRGISAALDATRFLTDLGFNKEVASRLNILPVDEDGLEIAENAVQEITTARELNDIVGDGKQPVIVDFYAETCPSCINMLPTFAAVATSYEGRIAFAKVDADQADGLIEKYNILKVPCLLCFKDGKICGRYNKTMSHSELKDLAEDLLS